MQATLLPTLRSASLAVILAVPAVAHAVAETRDDSRLRQIAGQAASYAGEVRALLARGANPNLPGDGGRTALHAAARIGAAETLRALLEAGGKPDVQDEDGNTPLHFAADASEPTLTTEESVAAIRVLLRGDADARIANARGRSPLHLAAASHDRAGGVAALLGARANPNRRDRDGATPLHAAVDHRGRTRVVGALIAGGADPRAANGAGLTALQLFVRTGPDEGEVAAMLIGAGADPDRKYPNGEAPLHAAIRTGGNRGKVRIAEALLAGGADPCIRDAKRYTPYQVAAEGGDIHRALDRAGGYDRACDRKGERVASGAARKMQARTRVNVRSGPGTRYDKVGLLETGQEVRVTGKAGEWLRIEGPQGGEAFVHASFLVDAGARATLDPKCAGRKKGAKCWKETTNKRGCHVWTTHFLADRTVTWSGACPGGVADGRGTLVWIREGKSTESTGALDRGKKQGKWGVRYANGTVLEGPYVNGRANGRFVVRYAKGGVHEGEAVDGQKHGRWVERDADGDVREGPFVKGKKHGKWVTRSADGGIAEWLYKNGEGKLHGRWASKFKDGGRSEGSYVHGKKHGRWVSHRSDGAMTEGSYLDGKEHGRWIHRLSGGSVFEHVYEHGKRNGPSTTRFSSGGFHQGNYVDDKKHGRWVEHDSRGYVAEGTYAHGNKQGEWVLRKGTFWSRTPWVDGKVHGLTRDSYGMWGCYRSGQRVSFGSRMESAPRDC